MTTLKHAAIAMMSLTLASPAAAQQPPRPNDSARTVTLSLTEYNRLTDLANRPPQGPALAPVAAVLAGADLRVRVDRDVARGLFNLTGDVLRPGVNRVHLISGATLIDAATGGRPLPLISDGNQHSALLPGPGPFTASLDWGGALIFTPGRASFTLPVPPSGTARATIDLPGEQADVRLSAGLITRRSTAGGRTIIEATLDPGSSTEVSWSMRDSAPVAAAREVRTLADVMTLVTLGDSDVRMAALVDVTVVQGEPRTFEVRLPAGYELTSLSGSSIETSETREGVVTVTLNTPAARRHQFLFGLERAHTGGSFSLSTELVTLPNVQRERGEVALEGVGTLELAAAERDDVQRIDGRELSAPLRSLARLSILSAFRYQGRPGSPRTLALDVKRFGDAGVLAAVADRATVTTLVTTEGRALTEIVLRLQNRAQPFVKVMLPPEASMVSVEVAGESAKPALGIDGTRVPLLRAGFRPQGPYTVSFVYLHSGAPFARKGDMSMALPKMDIPVSLIEWEVFVPERYAVRAVGGNVIDRSEYRRMVQTLSGSAVGANVVTLGAALGESETGSPSVNVVAEAPAADVQNARAQATLRALADGLKQVPSQNVINLQRRAAGVLPVRVDVPRAGTSHQFVRPLVVDQETVVNLRYKTR